MSCSTCFFFILAAHTHSPNPLKTLQPTIRNITISIRTPDSNVSHTLSPSSLPWDPNEKKTMPVASPWIPRWKWSWVSGPGCAARRCFTGKITSRPWASGHHGVDTRGFHLGDLCRCARGKTLLVKQCHKPAIWVDGLCHWWWFWGWFTIAWATLVSSKPSLAIYWDFSSDFWIDKVLNAMCPTHEETRLSNLFDYEPWWLSQKVFITWQSDSKRPSEHGLTYPAKQAFWLRSIAQDSVVVNFDCENFVVSSFSSS